MTFDSIPEGCIEIRALKSVSNGWLTCDSFKVWLKYTTY
jgi:hypothetical protein